MGRSHNTGFKVVRCQIFDRSSQGDNEAGIGIRPSHVTTEPSFFRAAKALSVEKILETPLDREEETALEPPVLATNSQ